MIVLGNDPSFKVCVEQDSLKHFRKDLPADGQVREQYGQGWHSVGDVEAEMERIWRDGVGCQLSGE